VRYKPLLVNLTRPDDFEAEMSSMQETLDAVLPKFAAYFQNDGFLAIKGEFESFAKRSAPRGAVSSRAGGVAEDAARDAQGRRVLIRCAAHAQKTRSRWRERVFFIALSARFDRTTRRICGLELHKYL
jgi:hypothetical protein